MPITASAKKALRQSIRRRAQNLKRSIAYKSAIKDLKKLVAGLPAEALAKAGQTKETQNQLAKAYQAIDKAAKTGVIKKNKAARLKSSVAKLLAKK